MSPWSSCRVAATACPVPRDALPCANPAAVAGGAGTLISGERRIRRNGAEINHLLGVSAFAEYATCSRNSLVKIDPEVPLEQAALFGCAVLTGVGAVVNTARVEPGSTVAVVGLGGVGLSTILGAVAAGARADRRRRPFRGQAGGRHVARRNRQLQGGRRRGAGDQGRNRRRRPLRLRNGRSGPRARPRLPHHPARRHDHHRRPAATRTPPWRCPPST